MKIRVNKSQFTRYNGINGIQVDLMLNPMYDDRTYCKRTHPMYPNRPIDSFRMDILDFGTADGTDNIQLLSVKDTYYNFVVSGSHTPSGPISNGGQASSAIQGYSLHMSASAGLVIRDVSRTGSIVFETAE